jgi:hypothetical protein
MIIDLREITYLFMDSVNCLAIQYFGGQKACFLKGQIYLEDEGRFPLVRDAKKFDR